MAMKVYLAAALLLIIANGAWAQSDLFYISAYYARNWQSMNLSGETWSYGGGDSGIINTDSGKIIVSPGKKYTHSAPGGNKICTDNRAVLAFGIDPKQNFSLPLRFEIAVALPDVVNVSYAAAYEEYGSGTEAEIPVTETFSAQQFLQVKYFPLVLNGYFDFHNRTGFIPYIGIGGGATYYSAKLATEISVEYREQTTTPGLNIGFADHPEKFDKNINGWLFTFSAAAGVAYRLTDSVVIDLAYRYTYIDEISFVPSFNGTYSEKIPLIIETSGQKLSSDVHQIILGMRFIL